MFVFLLLLFPKTSRKFRPFLFEFLAWSLAGTRRMRWERRIAERRLDTKDPSFFMSELQTLPSFFVGSFSVLLVSLERGRVAA